VNLTVFAAPMFVLYGISIAVAWLFARKQAEV
jgi:Sec-independent protein secretion pathway component TatC